MIVRNRCTKCRYSWKDQPGAFSLSHGKCPKCGSRYFRWTTYNKDKENKKYKEAVSDIYKGLHEKTMSKALEAGQFLVDKYRDLPDGEINDESDYDHIDI